MRKIVKCIVVSVHLASLILFLFAFVVLHVIFNNDYEYYMFFDVEVTQYVLFDFCLLLIGIGFVLEVITTLWLSIQEDNILKIQTMREIERNN